MTGMPSRPACRPNADESQKFPVQLLIPKRKSSRWDVEPWSTVDGSIVAIDVIDQPTRWIGARRKMAHQILVFYGFSRSDRMGIRLADFIIARLRARGVSAEINRELGRFPARPFSTRGAVERGRVRRRDAPR
jgi:hypothetical protein